MEKKIEVQLVEATVEKLNLVPFTDTLVVKVISDTVTEEAMGALGEQLRQRFPNNKVIVFSLPVGEDIKLTKIDNSVYTPNCAEQTSYCNNCSCGKKERIEGNENETT